MTERECYGLEGRSSDIFDDSPCYSSAGDTMCCPEDETCQPNGLCKYSDRLWFRRTCTDQTFKSSSCVDVCGGITNSFSGSLYGCQDGSFCCEYTNDSCCDNGSSFTLPNLSNADSTGSSGSSSSPSGSSISSASPTSDTITGPSSSFTIFSGSGDSYSNTGRSSASVIGIAVGVGLVIPLLWAIIAGCVLFFLYRKRKARRNNAPPMQQQPMHQQFYPSPPPPQQRQSYGASSYVPPQYDYQPKYPLDGTSPPPPPPAPYATPPPQGYGQPVQQSPTGPSSGSFADSNAAGVRPPSQAVYPAPGPPPGTSPAPSSPSALQSEQSMASQPQQPAGPIPVEMGSGQQAQPGPRAW
ncbi:MAG: hypothetical protein M1833_002799 [Piccolia ochrophora]|nr:MAG: hypothetical protein M1833_002799 [Piccolia ochrophora]